VKTNLCRCGCGNYTRKKNCYYCQGHIPKGMTEEQVLAIFDEVIKKVASKYKFGSFELADVKQEALLAAFKGLEYYDEKRPLANFIFVHIKNRLYNFKRDNYIRLEKPCIRCPIAAYKNGECTAYTNLEDCKWYAKWLKRNSIKRNLTHTLEYTQVNATSEANMEYGDNMVEYINSKEILSLIDKELPINLRKTYLQMISGDKVSKKDRMEVEEAVLTIIRRNNYEL